MMLIWTDEGLWNQGTDIILVRSQFIKEGCCVMVTHCGDPQNWKNISEFSSHSTTLLFAFNKCHCSVMDSFLSYRKTSRDGRRPRNSFFSPNTSTCPVLHGCSVDIFLIFFFKLYLFVCSFLGNYNFSILNNSCNLMYLYRKSNTKNM